MELELPTGDSGGGDHLAKFLSTLTELVELLGKTGPGGASGGASPTGGAVDTTGGKSLIKATAKLFNDLANAFKPLKTVLAKFGTITPAAAKAEPAPAPVALEAPPAAEAQADEAKPKRKSRKKKAAEEEAPTPVAAQPTPKAPKKPKKKANDDDEAEQGQEPTPVPVAALTIQDASIGIDFASVKMPAAPAPKAPKAKPEPEPEQEQAPLTAKVIDIDTNLVKITVPTASFKIASALLQGKFLMPPDMARPDGDKGEPQAEAKDKPKADEAPAPTPKAPKPEKTPAQAKPKNAQGESAAGLLTWGNVFKRLIGGVDERKGKPKGKDGAEKDRAEKETPEKAEGTQEKNTSAKEASQNLQNAIINIANGVVNVTTGEKKEEKKPDDNQDNNSDAAKDFAQSQANQVKGTGPKPMPKGGAGGPKPMPAGGGGPKPMPTGGAGGGPKMGDPRAMIVLAVAKIVTSLSQSAIALAHKGVDVIQKAEGAVGSGVAAPFKAVGNIAMAGASKLMTAFSDPIGAFKELTGMMIGFVAAVSPATVMMFTKAMTDVSAIIGKALAPALTIATEVVRELGDILGPMMALIAPTITQVARAFGDMFISMIRVWAVYEQLLLPVLKSVAIVLAGLARIVTALLEGIVVILAGFLGTFTGLDDVVQTVVDSIVEFTKWIVRAAVALTVMVAKMFGATGFIDNMKKIAGNKGAVNRADATGVAAPTGGQFQSAESFGKNIAQASFTATSVAAAPKKTDDFLADMSKDIEAMAQIDLKQIIIDAIVGAAKTTVKETVSTVGNVAYEASGMGVVNRTGAALGEWVGGMLFG